MESRLKLLVLKIFLFVSWLKIVHASEQLDHLNFLELSMDFWTKIDNIRSINTTPEQKIEFLTDYLDQLLLLYKKIDTIDFECPCKDRQELAAIIFEIRHNFSEIFETIKNDKAYLITEFMLNKTLDKLKTPRYIQA